MDIVNFFHSKRLFALKTCTDSNVMPQIVMHYIENKFVDLTGDNHPCPSLATCLIVAPVEYKSGIYHAKLRIT